MRAFRDDGFPVTIVRPSLTYGDTQVPLAVNSWALPYTAIARMRVGKPLIVPGDGTSLWTITHNSDFAQGFLGLLGRRQAVGHAFNIMSDEVLTWDEIYRAAPCWATSPRAPSSTRRRSSASCPTSAPRRRSRRGSGGPSPGSTRTPPDSRWTLRWTPGGTA